MPMAFADYEEVLREDPAVLRSGGDRFREAVERYVLDGELDDAVRTVAESHLEMLDAGTIGPGYAPDNEAYQEFMDRAKDAFAEYIDTDDGRMYTWNWVDVDESGDQITPADDGETIRAPMNPDPVQLYNEAEREALVEDIAARGNDLPESARLDLELDPSNQLFMDHLLDAYDGDRDTVRENHVEVVRISPENWRGFTVGPED